MSHSLGIGETHQQVLQNHIYGGDHLPLETLMHYAKHPDALRVELSNGVDTDVIAEHHSPAAAGRYDGMFVVAMTGLRARPLERDSTVVSSVYTPIAKTRISARRRT